MISLSHTLFAPEDMNKKYYQYVSFLREGKNYEEINNRHKSDNKVLNEIEAIADVAYIVVVLDFLKKDTDKMNVSSSSEDMVKALNILKEIQELAKKFKQNSYLSICQEYGLEPVSLNNDFADSLKSITTTLKTILTEQKNASQNSNKM